MQHQAILVKENMGNTSMGEEIPAVMSLQGHKAEACLCAHATPVSSATVCLLPHLIPPPQNPSPSSSTTLHCPASAISPFPTTPSHLYLHLITLTPPPPTPSEPGPPTLIQHKITGQWATSASNAARVAFISAASIPLVASCTAAALV